MAKKDKNQLEPQVEEPTEEEKEGGKGSTIIIVLLIVLIWLGAFIVLIKLNVGNFGSEVLYPVLKDVPVLNMILPSVSESDESGKYNYRSVGEAVERIKELEKQLDSTNNNQSASSDEIKELKAEVARLKVFEEDQNNFSKRVKEFDDKVVFNEKAPELEEYKTFYEGISPDNAEKIYKQVVEQLQYTQKIKDQADIYSKMEPAAAAARLETMTGDLDLLASIFDCMQPSKSALILQNMSAEAAAQVTKKMTLKK